MIRNFQPGDRVFWWKRITSATEYPYRATVMSVGPKRITIAVEDVDGNSTPVIRHVDPRRLQPVERYIEMAADQVSHWIGPSTSWGRCTIYLEIGEDLRPVREVSVFANGNCLSYDRCHWVDDFGMLADGRINRNRKEGPWGRWVEISAAEFERVWIDARRSALWEQQAATARMSELGSIPPWLTITGWRPRVRMKKRGARKG